MQLPPYTTGTVSVADGETTLVFTGGIITDIVARRGDVIYVNNQQPGVEIFERTDNSHCEIAVPWSSGDMVDVPFTIVPNFPARVAGAEAAEDVTRLVAALNTNGLPWLVPSDLTAPDPSWGDEGQVAEQRSTGKQWHKEGGVWVYDGIFKGLGVAAPYDNGKTYSLNDVATSGGSSYVWINPTPGAGHAPPNATYWDVLAARGATGPSPTIAVGTVTTGSPGSSASVINVGTAGAAVFDFTIPRGTPGAGDMSSANYGSEYSGNLPLLRSNIGAVAAKQLLAAGNANSMVEDGNYSIDPPVTNMPDTGKYWILTVARNAANSAYVVQTAREIVSGNVNVYERRNNNGSWTSWRRIAYEFPDYERVYTTPGSDSFVTPADSSTETIYEYEILAPGGGGGAADGTTAAAGGGGSGAEAGGTFTGVAPSTSISLTLGIVGLGVGPGNGKGGNGGTTSIGSPVNISCGGGVGGNSSASGAASSGTGGTVTGSPNRYARPGQRGFPGQSGSTVTLGAGGDGAGSSKGNGGIGGRAGLSANALAAASGFGAGGGGAFYQTATGSNGSGPYIRIKRIWK